MTTRVLIADAHTVLRQGLRLIIQEDPKLTVIEEAATSAETLEKALTLEPDVVLMDVNMPDARGIATIRQIRSLLPQTQVLILTVTDRSDSMLAACKAGAKGYLLKNVSGNEVIRAIHQVAVGQAILSPPVTTCLLDELATPSPSIEELTDREMDVLRYLSRGFGNKEIAKTLNISQNTVKTHVRRIFSKLHLRNRTEAATLVVQTNFLSHN
jgi:two-component system, NarL family, response regulator LiaR